MAKLMARELVGDLSQGSACQAALDWLEDKGAYEAWRTCPLASWLSWILLDVDNVLYDRGIAARETAIANKQSQVKALRREIPWPEVRQALKDKGVL